MVCCHQLRNVLADQRHDCCSQLHSSSRASSPACLGGLLHTWLMASGAGSMRVSSCLARPRPLCDHEQVLPHMQQGAAKRQQLEVSQEIAVRLLPPARPAAAVSTPDMLSSTPDASSCARIDCMTALLVLSAGLMMRTIDPFTVVSVRSRTSLSSLVSSRSASRRAQAVTAACDRGEACEVRLHVVASRCRTCKAVPYRIDATPCVSLTA